MKRALLTAALAAVAATAISCSKKYGKATGLSGLGAPVAFSRYEVQCPTAADLPRDYYSEPVRQSNKEPPLPDTLPWADIPVTVSQCDGLGGAPKFWADRVPGVAVIVDCNAGVVRFRSRDWQVKETADIGLGGDIDTRLMYIVRLRSDAAGNENCWARMLGHVRGKVRCSPDPGQVRLDLEGRWTFDTTITEAMESAPQGLEDLRNGTRCIIGPQNCQFFDSGALGCNGGL